MQLKSLIKKNNCRSKELACKFGRKNVNTNQSRVIRFFSGIANIPILVLLFVGFCISACNSNNSKPENGKAAETAITEPEILTTAEQMPEPPFDLNEYLSKNIKYPEQAREKNIQGRVTVKFVVNEEGSIGNVTILNGISNECDDEAKRVVTAMPKWKPGKDKGKNVKVYFTLPINFKLE